jgi:hypothetical protein
VHERDQQVNQGVCDLRRAQPAQRGQQRQSHRPRRRAQARRVGVRRPRPPRLHQLLRSAREQVAGQAERANPLELVDLAQQRLQPHPARVGLQLGKRAAAAHIVTGQRLQPRGRLLRQARHRLRTQPLLRSRPRRSHHALQASHPRRLEALGAESPQQRLTQPLIAQLDRTDLLGQPRAQALLVGDRRLAEPQRLPDLGPVVLDRPSLPVIAREQRRLHAHLLGEIPDRDRRYLARPAREARLELEELQQHREAEPRRARLVTHQPPVVLDQCPARDQLLRLPLRPHGAEPRTPTRASLAATPLPPAESPCPW